MKLSSLICSAMMLLPLAASAQAGDPAEEVTLLTFHFTDGHVEQFNLPDLPVITFDGEMLNVASMTLEGSYNRADIENFNFEKGKPVVGIAEAAADFANSMTVTFVDNRTLTVSAGSLGRVIVTDLTGRTAATAAAIDGTATLDLSNLPAGVYVVKPDTLKGFKIIKK